MTARTEVSDTGGLTGAEFERRVRKMASRMSVACEFVASKGKGSHGRLYLGKDTTLKDRRKEIGRDLLAKMCRDLKIDPREL